MQTALGQSWGKQEKGSASLNPSSHPLQFTNGVFIPQITPDHWGVFARTVAHVNNTHGTELKEYKQLFSEKASLPPVQVSFFLFCSWVAPGGLPLPSQVLGSFIIA